MASAAVEFIKKIPKVELHLHIEGTLTPQLRFKLAQKHQIPQKWATEAEAVEDYRDSFDKMLRKQKDGGSLTFFDLYYGAMEVLKTEEDYYELAMGYFTKAAETNVRYSEVFFDPQAHTRRGVELDRVMSGLRRAQLDAQEKLGFHCNWIMCFLRDESPESAMETYEAALKYRDMIHGIGLDSLEDGRPPSLFNDVYKRAKADGFHLTAHCDVDAQDTHKHIHYCLTELGGDGIRRIDHGLNAVEQPELLEILKTTNTGLTCCLWGAYGYLFQADEEQRLFRDMLRRLFDYGILVTINSDDPACHGMNYVEDNLILVADKCGFTAADIVKLQQNAVQISWAPDSLKQSILKEIQVVAAQAVEPA